MNQLISLYLIIGAFAGLTAFSSVNISEFVLQLHLKGYSTLYIFFVMAGGLLFYIVTWPRHMIDDLRKR